MTDQQNEHIAYLIERFSHLVKSGHISADKLERIMADAQSRGVSPEKILRHEHNIPRRAILETLSGHYHCERVEYDERLPVPSELLTGLDTQNLLDNLWFPVIKDNDTIIIAANDPEKPELLSIVRDHFQGSDVAFRVALAEDIIAFIRDFLNADPAHISGNERTSLAVWRNNMARLRTRMACYRTDFAVARTRLSLMRGGLSVIMIGRALLHLRKASPFVPFFWFLIALGFIVAIYGLIGYFRLKTSVFSPPGQQTLIEVNNASFYFFENYNFLEEQHIDSSSKKTMLARLSKDVFNYRVSLENSCDNKQRSTLAHERNILAAQRTVLSCYRTIYARARVGLSFIRTGVSFSSIALGLMKYFGFNALTVLDCFLLIAGIAMIIDGLVWYWPVHKEQQAAM